MCKHGNIHDVKKQSKLLNKYNRGMNFGTKEIKEFEQCFSISAS